jgi:hypothetical protein
MFGRINRISATGTFTVNLLLSILGGLVAIIVRSKCDVLVEYA